MISSTSKWGKVEIDIKTYSTIHPVIKFGWIDNLITDSAQAVCNAKISIEDLIVWGNVQKDKTIIITWIYDHSVSQKDLFEWLKSNLDKIDKKSKKKCEMCNGTGKIKINKTISDSKSLLELLDNFLDACITETSFDHVEKVEIDCISCNGKGWRYT